MISNINSFSILHIQEFFRSDDQTKETQTSQPMLYDQLHQLVDRSSQLMTKTQKNLTNLSNMIDHIQSVLYTNTSGDTIKSANHVNIPKIQIDTTNFTEDDTKSDQYEYELQEMNTLIPISPATSISSVPPAASRPESPYPRIYPIINPGGDAVIIHNSYTMEDEEIVIQQVDTSLDAGRMWEEANQLMQISPPNIDVSLDADEMWQEIMKNVSFSCWFILLLKGLYDI